MAFIPHKAREWPVILDSLKLPRLHPNGYYYLHFRRQNEVTGETKAVMETTRSRTEAGAADYMRAFIDHHKKHNPGGDTPTPTIAALIRHYLNALEREGGRRAYAQTAALVFPRRLLGQLQPGQLDQVAVDDYIARRNASRTLNSGTLRRELSALQTALRWGTHRKLFPAADLHHLKLPNGSDPRVKFLDRATEARVQQEAAAIYLLNPGPDQRSERREAALFLVIALNTAARRGAVLGLTWERVDFALNEIDFRDPQRQATKKRRAVVPILPRLKPVLEQAHREACAREGARGRVFTKADVVGGWRAFQSLAKELGVPWMTPHICRHTWATLALQDKKPALAIAGMMADTLATLDRNYAHVTKALLHETFT